MRLKSQKKYKKIYQGTDFDKTYHCARELQRNIERCLGFYDQTLWAGVYLAITIMDINPTGADKAIRAYPGCDTKEMVRDRKFLKKFFAGLVNDAKKLIGEDKARDGFSQMVQKMSSKVNASELEAKMDAVLGEANGMDAERSRRQSDLCHTNRRYSCTSQCDGR